MGHRGGELASAALALLGAPLSVSALDAGGSAEPGAVGSALGAIAEVDGGLPLGSSGTLFTPATEDAGTDGAGIAVAGALLVTSALLLLLLTALLMGCAVGGPPLLAEGVCPAAVDSAALLASELVQPIKTTM